MVFLRAEGKQTNRKMQAAYKILLILIVNNHAMKFFLPFLFLISFFNSHAQQRTSEKAHELIDFSKGSLFTIKVKEFVNISSTTHKVQNKEEVASFRLFAQKIPLKKITPFLSFFCTWDEVNNDHENTIVRVRFSTNNNQWDEWIEIKPDEHLIENQNRFIGQLQYQDKKYQYYQVDINTNRSKKGQLLKSLYLNFFSAGNPASVSGRTSAITVPTTANRPNACNAPQPTFVSRAAWGATQVWSPSVTTVTHLIVHHAAVTNTSSDWGAVVLGIWNYHTTPAGSGGAGYSDIGYNWLVAPNGVLYEGRYNSSTSNIQGAHFCGTNQNTMGVCMLGDFTNITITAAAKTTLVQVLGWKACERAIDPLATSFHANSGLTINNISGHRDGCATQCPGNTFYPDLPGVRIDVKNYLDGTTPVTTIDGLEEFSISPNPVLTSAFIKLKFNTTKEIQYRILSPDGRIVFQSALQKVSGVFQQEITWLKVLPTGSYTLQLWVNKQMTSRQLIKQ